MRATDMLVCGEDLGMIPACVPPVMEQLGLVGAQLHSPVTGHPTSCMLHKPVRWCRPRDSRIGADLQCCPLPPVCCCLIHHCDLGMQALSLRNMCLSRCLPCLPG